MPGIGIGKGIGLGGGMSWMNWNPTKADDLQFWVDKRDGLLLKDTLSNDAQILVPTAYFPGNGYITRSSTKPTGGQAWDLTIRFKVTNAANNNPLFSCGGYSSGAKGIMVRVNSGNIQAYTSNGSTSVNTSFTFGLQNNTWYSLRFQWSGVEGETMTATIGSTVRTSTTNKAWSGTSTDDISFGRYGTAAWMTGNISSVIGTYSEYTVALYPTALSDGPGTARGEISTNGAAYSWVNLTTDYLADGETHCLDKGWSIWRGRLATTEYIYCPNDSSGNQVNVPAIAGYDDFSILYSSSVGRTIYHNLWKSKIRFAGTFFDRSNTTIWNNACRAAADYDAGNTKDFSIDSINLKTLYSWLNDGYRGRLYPKFGDNSIDTSAVSGDNRDYMKEIILLGTDKKGKTLQRPILYYTQDIRRTQKYSDLSTYYTDSDGYLQIYNYTDLGGDPDANYAAFSAMLSSSDNVTFSGNKYEVYALQQPLLPTAGQTVTVNCELRAKKATIVNITQNVAINDTHYHVDSVSGFHVGEWIGISDDDQTDVQSGERKNGNAGKITSIDADNLIISVNQAARYAITAASNAKLGHINSVILIEGQNGVTINGTGRLNGNWENQYGTSGASVDREEVRASCCISSDDSNNTSISGTLDIFNGVLHGISISDPGAVSKVTGCSITGITTRKNYNKGILGFKTDGLIISGVTAKDSLYEDGIIMYSENINFSITNVIVENNFRTGLNINSNGICNGTISGVTIIDDEISIVSSDVSISNVTLEGISYIRISGELNFGDDIQVSGVEYNECTATNLFQIVGGCDSVVVENLVFNDCTGVGIFADDISGGGVFPTNCTINGGGFYNHTGTKASIDASADVVISNMVNYP